ncbi:PREDICTED: phenolic glucoside malonyltransferase 1-like [Fragaria vesca subsp. vesca]|uniref:phenolic glucoside malonyltransferase 1-like n=1 Tax=Fragaria vesca subsp. vesca TaxID=101020 RepID=UPI0002C34D78|nr:PREDICTED: phenolic glucoside malonyltransferase 1-like [Fragaria vesca subsp. vesca]XP_011467879.1 PREDICTED: phenolic glucoside malonyltransferase 1-like [Fragaria vesca subsp. vesca]
MANLSVKKVEVCRVAPKQGSPENQSSLPLTFFDLLWLRFPPVELLYIYQTSSTDSVLSQLKTSLSLALQHFPPLAGNLIWPQDSLKPLLSYVQGDAVSVTVAESDADFDHLINSVLLAAKDFSPLVPQLDVTDDRAAAMALQITVFPNRGFSIGTAMHHAILDWKTWAMFVKAWAHICKHEEEQALPSSLVPFYDRRVVKDPAGLGELYSKEHRYQDGRTDNRSLSTASLGKAPKATEDLIRGTFEFTRALIQRLRADVTTKTASASSLHLSTFSLVCAYTWVCMVKAEEIKGGTTILIFAVDSRSRLDPPIPATYFGNCIVGRVAVAETKGLLSEDGLVVAVNAITEALRSLEKGVLDGAEDWVSKFVDFSLYDRIYSIAGSHRLEVYDTDFGWGRPKRVEVISIDRTGAISLLDSKNGGGGVEVGLVLKKHYMEAFDALFASLVH